ncbi:uncharacterized protein [Dermacentor andersoni]|uniref:uncharacterized protein n=1 Tax=Dermacentor andersoni TaxID=34620 RepID=UPI00215503FA|nr:uncharacterized protein LOC126536714 [Dermacentor andersoni]
MEENKDAQPQKTGPVLPTQDAPTTRDMQGQAAHPEGDSREDLSSKGRLQDAAERTSCGTATAKSLERQTVTEGEQTTSAADPVLLPEVREEPGLLAKPGTPAPATTAIHNETAEQSRSSAASPDAAPKNTATATTKDSAVAENASVEATKGHEQGCRPKLGGQRSSAKPAPPHSPSSTPGATTPLREMEESVDRSADRQLRPLGRSWKLKAACFALTLVLLIVVSGIVVYKYVVLPKLLVAPLRSNRSTVMPRAGSATNFTLY